MQDSTRKLIPIFLLGYNLFALNSLKHFAIQDYDYVTLRELPSEISVHLTTTRSDRNGIVAAAAAASHNNVNNKFNDDDDADDEHGRKGTMPYCPPIVEYDSKSWERIKHSNAFWGEENLTDFDEKIIAQRFGMVKPGGWWKPANCDPIHEVTLIIPYRDRAVQLKKFLVHMHTFLQLQLIQYRILVVEQVDDDKAFNRGKLLNIGFAESVKNAPTHCYIFHDVDLLPENIKNIYGCTQHPRHMSAAVNSFRYLLDYKELFGGAVAITRDQFTSVNGFSNSFYGWGGEDDDLFRRFNDKGIKIIRLSPIVSSYRMLPHQKQVENDSRFDNLKKGKERYENDGLNSLHYTVVNHIEGLLYTLIQVRL